MPYRLNVALPAAVRNHLPAHAQEIFRKAFNSAAKQYAAGNSRAEEIAMRVAWSAVKKVYEKHGNAWVRKIKAAAKTH
jgi:cation transport regulator